MNGNDDDPIKGPGGGGGAGGAEPPEMNEVLSIAALLPTSVERVDGEWQPVVERSERGRNVWRMPTVGEHWQADDGSPPPWLRVDEPKDNYHYVLVPGYLVISSSLDVDDGNQEIPWDPLVSFDSNYVKWADVDKTNAPGVHSIEVGLELPEQSNIPNLSHLGSMELTLDVGSSSRFHDAIARSGVSDAGTSELALETGSEYGALYSHQEAFGDALKVAYDRLVALHSLASVGFSAGVTTLAAGGATFTVEAVAEGAKGAAKTVAMNLATKEVLNEAFQRLEPASEEVTADDLEEARLVQGTAFYTLDAGRTQAGFSGPMLVVRSP